MTESDGSTLPYQEMSLLFSRSDDFMWNFPPLPGFEVKEKFLEDSEKFYEAKPMTLSGISEDDLIAINKWVKEATNGQIPTFLQQLPENTVMLLLNAIHFHGELHRPYFSSLIIQRNSSKSTSFPPAL